jgi:hypothetical protein
MEAYLYILYCKNSLHSQVYVGSTHDIDARMSAHKCALNNKKANTYNYPVYEYIRNTGGWYNWDVSYKKIKVINSKHLRYIERYNIETQNCKLNTNKPMGDYEYYAIRNGEAVFDDTTREGIKWLIKKDTEKENEKELRRLKLMNSYNERIEELEAINEKLRDEIKFKDEIIKGLLDKK